jgi:hypothetical protein
LLIKMIASVFAQAQCFERNAIGGGNTDSGRTTNHHSANSMCDTLS